MQHIIISCFLILILVFSDLIPQIKRKETKALCFAVPAYILALVIDILVGLNVKVISPTQIIFQLIQAVFKMK